MGWWSETIMGGDSPLDWQYDIDDVLGYDRYPDDEIGLGPLTADYFDGKWDAIEQRIVADQYDPEIGWQVLGVMAMEVGADIPNKIRQKIIEGAEADTWAQENNTRKKYINNFIDTVRGYVNGIPAQVKQEGLFEKIFADLGGK